MMIVLLLSALVYQNGDTLRFVEKDSVVDQWILGEKTDTNGIMFLRLAKISDDHEKFFIYEKKDSNYILVEEKMILYNADAKPLWTEVPEQGRSLSFAFSNIYDNLLIIVDTDPTGKYPRLFAIKKHTKEMVFNFNAWIRLIDYEISPNNRYLVLHTRKRKVGQFWDFVASYDLVEKKEWQYLFPICVSCKRSTLGLKVDDSGQVEVIYGTEHRVFSCDGSMIRYFGDME